MCVCLFLYMCVCFCACMCTCMLVPMEARRGSQIPWNWSPRQLWVGQHSAGTWTWVFWRSSPFSSSAASIWTHCVFLNCYCCCFGFFLFVLEFFHFLLVIFFIYISNAIPFPSFPSEKSPIPSPLPQSFWFFFLVITVHISQLALLTFLEIMDTNLNYQLIIHTYLPCVSHL